MSLFGPLFLICLNLCSAYVSVPLSRRSGENEVKVGQAGVIPVYDDFLSMYYTTMKIGTPPQTFNVQIDTGSANFWVVGAGATCGSSCPTQYNPSKSSTYVALPGSFNITYADGSVISGTFANETVVWGNLTIPNVEFAMGVDVSPDALGNRGQGVLNDGIIGLAFQGDAVGNVNTVIGTILAEHLATSPVFSLYLTLQPDKSEMILGGYDASKVTNGSLTYVPVVPLATPANPTKNPGYWMVNVDTVSVGDITLATQQPLYVDSGTTLVVVDQNTYNLLINALGIQDAIGLDGTIDCSFVDQLPSINFVFNGKNFPLSPGYYLLPSGRSCVFGFQGADLPIDGWILGDVYLRSFYTIYDIGNMQVGIANLTVAAQNSPITPDSNPSNPNSWNPWNAGSNIYPNFYLTVFILFLTALWMPSHV